MSQPSPSTTLPALFDAALQDYRDKTGNTLTDHPIAKQLEACESVDSITAILQEQARSFREFRENDGRLMKALNSSVDVLCTPSISTALNEAVGLVPFPPAKAIFAGFGILLTTVNEIRASYDALVDLFASFENFLSRLRIYAGIPPTPTLTDVLVKIIVELISTLALSTKQVKQGRFKKLMGKLRGEKDIEATIQRLDRLTLDEGRATAAQTLEVVYGLVQQKRAIIDDADVNDVAIGVSRALESMQETVNELKKEQRDKLQQDVRNWLLPPDPWKNHSLAHESQHSGTGIWWIQGDIYEEWKSSGANSLLWIFGKPGAGKSVICSAVIEDIRILQKSGLASLAFFYCDFRDDQKKDRRGLLSSLLVQLGEQSNAYSTILSKFYEDHRRGSQQSHASDSELTDCLKDMLKLPGQATAHIIIDALDECPSTTGMPSPREKVLKLVEELANLHIPHLRICVTSRPEADIVPVLDPLAFRSVSLHGENGQIQDIAEYIKFQVRTDSKIQSWRASDKDLVIDVLTKRANGMFRWVFCQLAYLRHCLRGRIRRALDDLPDTLDETYARTLEDIGGQNWEYAHRLFQCVAVASRPLHVKELAEFLAFDFEDGPTPTFLAEWRPEDPAHAVLSTCSSLIAVVDADESPVIQFAHFSVKEYLTSGRLAEAKDTISRFHVSMMPAHTIVAQACLGVLLHLDADITKDGLEDFPLAEYAAEHWVDHVQFENVSSKMQDGMKCLFDPSESHLSILLWIYNPDNPQRRSERSDSLPKASTAPLHYAAFYDMQDVATFLIVEHSQNVNARGFYRRETPLHVTARRGNVGLAQILLEHGADREARDNNDWSPLESASSKGHVEVVQVLLEYGADANAQDLEKLTPLHVASNWGKPAVVRALLEHGADVKARRYDGQTPLHRASEDGVALILLEHGADANALETRNQTPLHSASENGRSGVVRVLLELGVDANARGNDGETPLHQAVGEEVALTLLKHGADKNALDTKNRTPLHLASKNNRWDVVRVLLEHGLDANARGHDGETPLHLALGEEIALILLEHGADVNALDTRNRTPLHFASENGQLGVVRVLLEHGVDVNARDANNATPLHLVPISDYLEEDRLEIVRLLLQCGSDIHALDNEGRTPCMKATEVGIHHIIQLLLENGAEDHRR